MLEVNITALFSTRQSVKSVNVWTSLVNSIDEPYHRDAFDVHSEVPLIREARYPHALFPRAEVYSKPDKPASETAGLQDLESTFLQT